MPTAQAGNIELVNTLLEPDFPGLNHRGGQVPDAITPEYTADRQKLRDWRLGLHLDRFEEVRKKFSDAGLNLFSYVMTFSDDSTDPEIDAVFQQMKALGVGIFTTNQTRVAMGCGSSRLPKNIRSSRPGTRTPGR